MADISLNTISNSGNILFAVPPNGASGSEAQKDETIAFIGTQAEGKNDFGPTLTGSSVNFHLDNLTTGSITDVGSLAADASAPVFIMTGTDNLSVLALTPGSFIQTGSGNDTLTAFNKESTSPNILDGGSGTNVFGAPDPVAGKFTDDIFIADATSAATNNTITNFAGADVAVIKGLNTTDFAYSEHDTGAGLRIDATPNVAGKGFAASLTIKGFTTADLGKKLELAWGTTGGGQQFMFLASTDHSGI
jgi:hypothetical protein